MDNSHVSQTSLLENTVECARRQVIPRLSRGRAACAPPPVVSPTLGTLHDVVDGFTAPVLRYVLGDDVPSRLFSAFNIAGKLRPAGVSGIVTRWEGSFRTSCVDSQCPDRQYNGLSHQFDTVTLEAHGHLTATRRCLIRAHLSSSRELRPIRCQGAMSGAGDWIFVDSDPRSEVSRDEIIGAGTCRRYDHAEEEVALSSLPEKGEIGS
jgi:hypothetical protein